LQNGTFCPISASGSNFNPRNIQYIPAIEIFAFLELEQKLPVFKGLNKTILEALAFMEKLGLFLLDSYLNLLRFLWQNIAITHCEALVYMMLDTGFRIKKRVSSIEHPESSILSFMAQTLMPRVFSFLVSVNTG